MVVVVGGDVSSTEGGPTNSILRLTKNNSDNAWSWQPGPAMTQKRFAHAAVVCQGHVYAIGGGNGDEDEDYPTLDTLERIAVNDIFRSHSSNGPSAQAGSTSTGWTLLPCRLSSKKCGFAAAVVQDRWIVVAGGYDLRTYLSTVDIVDTQGSTVPVLAGPPLNEGRVYFGMAVIGSCAYAVGGQGDDETVTSVEYLEFDNDWRQERPATTTGSPPCQSWTLHPTLVLEDPPRSNHGVVRVGSCLVVLGGHDEENDAVRSVQVLDTRNPEIRVWELPALTLNDDASSVVALSTGLVAIGGSSGSGDDDENDEEPPPLQGGGFATLPLVDQHSACFARLLALRTTTSSFAGHPFPTLRQACVTPKTKRHKGSSSSSS